MECKPKWKQMKIEKKFRFCRSIGIENILYDPENPRMDANRMHTALVSMHLQDRPHGTEWRTTTEKGEMELRKIKFNEFFF